MRVFEHETIQEAEFEVKIRRDSTILYLKRVILTYMKSLKPFFFKYDMSREHKVSELLKLENSDSTIHIETDFDSWEADFEITLKDKAKRQRRCRVNLSTTAKDIYHLLSHTTKFDEYDDEQEEDVTYTVDKFYTD